MTTKTIMKYAVKGILNEIKETEKSIVKGETLLQELSEGKVTKSPMNVTEIREVIRKKESHIKELESKKFELEWIMDTEL